MDDHDHIRNFFVLHKVWHVHWTYWCQNDMIFPDEIADEVDQLELLDNQWLVDIEHLLRYNTQEIDPIVLYIDPNHGNGPRNHDVTNDIWSKFVEHRFVDENQDLEKWGEKKHVISRSNLPGFARDVSRAIALELPR